MDDLENYGRRMNIRVEGISYEEGETENELREKVIVTFAKADVNFTDNDMVRFHRSSKPSIDEGGKTTAQVIVKLNSWKTSKAAHFGNKKAKENKLGFQIRHKLMEQLIDEPTHFPNDELRPV